MSQAEQLEHDNERTRAHIADTLDELRACMTPGHLLDQVADRLGRDDAAAFARNLKQQTVNNPLPIALIGAGLAWLMLGPRVGDGSLAGASGQRLRNAASGVAENARNAADQARRASSEKGGEWSERASSMGNDLGEGLSATTERARRAGADAAASMADAAQQSAAETADAVRDTAGSVMDSTRDAASRAADSLRSAADSTSDTMQRGYDAVADRARRATDAISGSTRAAGQRTWQSGSAFLDFCREQPLIVAGVGLALGAAIGALLPASDTEDRLMGETSDRVKEGAQDFATEHYETAKKVGERAVDAARDAATEEASRQAEEVKNTDVSKHEEAEQGGEAKVEGASLVPSDESELERRGQPWTAGNAPT